MVRRGLSKGFPLASGLVALLASTNALAGAVAAPIPEPDMFALLAGGAIAAAFAIKLRRK